MKKLVRLLSVFFLFTSVVLFTACPPTVGSTPDPTPAPVPTPEVVETFVELLSTDDSILIELTDGMFSSTVSIADFSLDGANKDALEGATLYRITDTFVIITINETFSEDVATLSIKKAALTGTSNDTIKIIAETAEGALPEDITKTFSITETSIGLIIGLHGGAFKDTVTIADFSFTGTNAQTLQNGTIERVSDSLVRITGVTLTTSSGNETVIIKKSALLYNTSSFGVAPIASAQDVTKTVGIDEYTASLNISLNDAEGGAFNHSLAASDFEISENLLQDATIFRFSDTFVSITLPKHSLNNNVEVTVKASAFAYIGDVYIHPENSVSAHVTGENNTFAVTVANEIILPVDFENVSFEIACNNEENAGILNGMRLRDEITVTRKSDTQFAITLPYVLPNADIISVMIDESQDSGETIVMNGAIITASYDDTLALPTEITSWEIYEWEFASKYNEAYILLYESSFKTPVIKNHFTFSGENASILSDGAFTIVEKSKLPTEIKYYVNEVDVHYGSSLTNAIKIETEDFTLQHYNDCVTVNLAAITGVGFMEMFAIPAPDAITKVTSSIQGFSENSTPASSLTIELIDGTFDTNLDAEDFSFEDISIIRHSDTSVTLVLASPTYFSEKATVTVYYSALATKSTAMTARLNKDPTDLEVSYTANEGDAGIDIVLENGGVFGNYVFDLSNFEFSGTNASAFSSGTVERISNTRLRIKAGSALVASTGDDKVTLKASVFAVSPDSATVTAFALSTDTLVFIEDVSAATAVLNVFISTSDGAFKPNVTADDIIVLDVSLEASDIFSEQGDRYENSYLSIILPKDHGLTGTVTVTIKESAFASTIQENTNIWGYSEENSSYVRINGNTNTFTVTLPNATLPDTLITDAEAGFGNYMYSFRNNENNVRLQATIVEGGINVQRINDSQFKISLTKTIPNTDVFELYLIPKSGTLHGLTVEESLEANVQPAQEISIRDTMFSNISASEFNTAYIVSFGGSFDNSINENYFSFTGENAIKLKDGTFSFVSKDALPSDLETFISSIEGRYGYSVVNAIKIVSDTNFTMIDFEGNQGFDDTGFIDRDAFAGNPGFLWMIASPSDTALINVRETVTASAGDNTFTVTLGDGEFEDMLREYDYYISVENKDFNRKIQRTGSKTAIITLEGETASAGDEVEISFDYRSFKTKCTGFAITSSYVAP